MPRTGTPLLQVNPDLALQADGWDPSAVAAGSNRRLPWRCPVCAFRWVATVASRSAGRGCPACSGKAVHPGFNDLATLHPTIAAQAEGWDPTTVTVGSSSRRRWRCPTDGYIYETEVCRRTGGRGCPACAGKVPLVGVNDLATLLPAIAEQAHGWDPRTVTTGSDKRMPWKCSKRGCGYVWHTSVANRKQGTGCPLCSNRVVVRGRNDLLTTNPHLASQAHGWDPATVHAGSEKRLDWRCLHPGCGTIWTTTANHRSEGQGCPQCALRSKSGGLGLLEANPLLAAQAHGWDPKNVPPVARRKLPWKCPDCEHVWEASVANRKFGSGCPRCSPCGYNESKPGYVYLINQVIDCVRIVKVGITNFPEQRLATHARNGWTVLDVTSEMPGKDARELEADTLRYLDRIGVSRGHALHLGRFDGYTEAWKAAELPISSVADLVAHLAAPHDLEGIAA